MGMRYHGRWIFWEVPRPSEGDARVRPVLKYLLLGVSLLWGVAIGGMWPRLIDIREKY